jgi:hypothetical protein
MLGDRNEVEALLLERVRRQGVGIRVRFRNPAGELCRMDKGGELIPVREIPGDERQTIVVCFGKA